jgi:hypothetical protein
VLCIGCIDELHVLIHYLGAWRLPKAEYRQSRKIRPNHLAAYPLDVTTLYCSLRKGTKLL